MRDRERKRETVIDDGDERESKLTRENTSKIIITKTNDERERERERE
jgi:hypothetical protein